MGVRPLSHSLIAIVDDHEPKVALISVNSGKVVAFYHRKGRGPGELEHIALLQLLSDTTLLIADPSQGRAIIWRFANGGTTTLSLPQSRSPRNVLPILVGYDENEQWVVRRFPMAAPQGVTARSVIESSTLVLVDSGGGRPLMRLPARALVVASTPRGVLRTGLSGLAPAAFALCDSGYVNVDTSGVRRFSLSGVPMGSHRHRFGWVPMSQSSRREFIRGAVSGVTDARTRAEMTGLLENQAKMTDRFFAGFFIAPDGTVWARVRNATENAVVQLDHDGAPKRAVAVPPGTAVVHVGVGYFIGMRTTGDPELPTFTLFSFADDRTGQHARWRCSRQEDY